MNSKIEPYKGIAVTYEEIRPSYPEGLIKDIISKTGIKLSDKLLEIGPGTGKATRQFAEKGFTIHGIELGEDMALVFRDKCSKYEKVTLDVSAFEQWNNTDNHEYDMIYSAQTFHWLDPKIKYEKCHKLLKDKGYLVLFWYTPSNDKLHKTREMEEKIEKIVEKYVSVNFIDKGKPERLKHDGVYNEDERKTEIESSGVFKLMEKIDYTYETRNNAEQYLKIMKSVPSFASILDGLDDNIIKNMDNEIKELINNNGGYIGNLLNYSLYISRKI